MGNRDYDFGEQHGHVRDGVEYGSDAYWANDRGVDAYNVKKLAERTTYEQQNRGPVSPMPSAALSVLLGVLICGYLALNWVLNVTESWQTQPYPYRLIALFYYVLVTLPLSGFAWIWSKIIFRLFDGYSLLSVLTALVAETFYLLFLAMIAGVLRGLLKRFRIGVLVILAPAAVALVWFLVSRYQ